MKNDYLVPVNVIDIVDKLNSEGTSTNERMNLVMRLEAIRDFCEQAARRYSGELDSASSPPVSKRYYK